MYVTVMFCAVIRPCTVQYGYPLQRYNGCSWIHWLLIDVMLLCIIRLLFDYMVLFPSFVRYGFLGFNEAIFHIPYPMFYVLLSVIIYIYSPG